MVKGVIASANFLQFCRQDKTGDKIIGLSTTLNTDGKNNNKRVPTEGKK